MRAAIFPHNCGCKQLLAELTQGDHPMKFEQAPELQTIHWLNAEGPITLDSLRGRVVMIEAFQMLCPGCVSHGLPQARRVAETFSSDDVCVLGLHTVFEHHAVQGTAEALEAFLHEYKITFPVGIDAPSGTGGPPKTMTAFNMRGTPTLLLLDRKGRIRKKHFGREQDMVIGAEIMALVCEERSSDSQIAGTDDDHCNEDGCVLPRPGESDATTQPS